MPSTLSNASIWWMDALDRAHRKEPIENVLKRGAKLWFLLQQSDLIAVSLAKAQGRSNISHKWPPCVFLLMREISVWKAAEQGHPTLSALHNFDLAQGQVFYFYVSVGSTMLSLSWCPQVELVRWTQSVGLTLVNRDLNSLQLKTPSGQILSFCILQIFPFTSESKRMGIIVRVWCMAAALLCANVTNESCI